MTDAATLLQRFYLAVENKDLPGAAASVQQLTQQFSHLADSWLAASYLAEYRGRFEQALQAIDQALSISAKAPQLLLRRLQCLQRCQQNATAIALAQQLCQLDSNDVHFISELALQCSQLQQYEHAAQLYRQALARQPDNAGLYYNYATVLRFCGKLTEAEQMLDRAIELQPDDTDAWHLRSNLRKQRSDNHHCQALLSELKRSNLTPKQQVQLHYALAKELEDLQDYPASFQHLQRGATIRRAHINYRLQHDLDIMQHISHTFDASFMQQHHNGYHSSEPVFIVSMPRAGSTLVERFLGCDSQIQLAGELTHFASQLSRLCYQQSGQRLTKTQLVQQAATLDFQALGQAYIDSTRPLTGAKAHFVDKLPLNFLYVGLIHKALPQAKIIHVQRNPIDHCYAIYKHLFADAYPFSYRLDELAGYYRAYQALMAHWQQCLPGVIHNVQYEDLIKQPEQTSQQLYQYCGLNWTADCLQFHQLNQQASTTGSASQVRQPLYNSSVARWRCYQDELSELINAFPDAAQSV